MGGCGRQRGPLKRAARAPAPSLHAPVLLGLSSLSTKYLAACLDTQSTSVCRERPGRGLAVQWPWSPLQQEAEPEAAPRNLASPRPFSVFLVGNELTSPHWSKDVSVPSPTPPVAAWQVKHPGCRFLTRASQHFRRHASCWRGPPCTRTHRREGGRTGRMAVLAKRGLPCLCPEGVCEDLKPGCPYLSGGSPGTWRGRHGSQMWQLI